MNKLATQLCLKDKDEKNKITLQTSQLWHNMEGEPTDFAPRWVEEFKIKQVNASHSTFSLWEKWGKQIKKNRKGNSN
jgi:hypothetical protein